MIKFDIRDLSFSYGEFPVLKNLNININDNTINVILGLNGSGKTTLIKLMTSVLSAPKNATGGKKISLSALCSRKTPLHR